jgi:hypothetical protein
MGNLTAAQQALAEFLEVDEDLLAGAGTGIPDLQAEKFPQAEIDDWLGKLPSDEVLTLLKQLLEGQGLRVEKTLRNKFSAWRQSLRISAEQTHRRSVKKIKKNAETAKKRRLEQEKSKQEQ